MKGISKALLLLSLTVGIGLFLPESARPTTTNPFPISPVIEPTVNFWIDVYTRYPLTAGILHDSRSPNVVYEVIDLIHPGQYGARKINQKKIRKVRKVYKTLLMELAQNPISDNPEAQRIAKFFGTGATSRDFQLAAGRIRCQVGQKDRFRDGLIRSGALIDEIQEIFRSRDLPEELAYLPHVESSFHNAAYSKHGAAGIWQFTRKTGKRLMVVNDVVDMRLDPIFASRAAVALLEENYRKLKSWPMAITAYNHGVSGVLRAKRKYGNYDGVFRNYRTRRFRFASRNFYPEFLAAREAVRNYQSYFGELQLRRPREVLTVRLPGYASFHDIAAHFKIDPLLLADLNPAICPPALRGYKRVPKRFELRIPANEWRTFLAAHSRFPEYRCTNRQQPSRVYRVKRGDTLTAIAKAHNVRVAELAAANDLNPMAVLRIRQKLKLPVTPDI